MAIINDTTPADIGLPYVGVIYGVAQDGDLLWHKYEGNGEENPSANRGWHPNSGNQIGNGWHNFQHGAAGTNEQKVTVKMG